MSNTCADGDKGGEGLFSSASTKRMIEADDVERTSVDRAGGQASALRAALAARTARANGDYWTFRHAAKARDAEHVIFQYPAMMVSPMQGALIDVLAEHRGSLSSVLDPFMGSGTTLIEAMRRGLRFTGSDLNPLAVMLARVESAEAARFDMGASLERVLRAYPRRRGRCKPPNNPMMQRWFRPDVASEMAALRASIRTEPQRELRRLWWACLAEVARVSSNARLSTPKLQHRTAEALEREIDVRARYEQIACRASGLVAARGDAMRAAGHVRGRRYRPGIELRLADARELPPAKEPAELILTSPPYGDNHTTMPYGQASFLSLCWIDVGDVGDVVPDELMATSRALDTASLGGSRRTAECSLAADLADRSPTLGRLLLQLEHAPSEAWRRVAAFFIDYDRAWASILKSASADAHLMLTLGERTVRGLHVATADITHELLIARGVEPVERLRREIPHNKRLARRNELASTISTETVLIMQRR